MRTNGNHHRCPRTGQLAAWLGHALRSGARPNRSRTELKQTTTAICKEDDHRIDPSRVRQRRGIFMGGGTWARGRAKRRNIRSSLLTGDADPVNEASAIPDI